MANSQPVGMQLQVLFLDLPLGVPVDTQGLRTPLTDRLGLYETDPATRLMFSSVLTVRLISGDLLPEKAAVALKQLTQCLMDFFIGE